MGIVDSLLRGAILSLLIFGNFSVASAQRDSIYVLPAGTRMKLMLDTELSSKFSSKNDTFVASVVRPLVIRDVVVLPAGTLIDGRVTSATAAAGGGKNGRLELSFVNIRSSDDVGRQIEAELVNKLEVKKESIGVLSVIGGAGLGALFGSISGSGRGALIGGVIGAGVGSGIALTRKGKDVGLMKNVEFEIELKKEVVLPVLDY